METNDTVTAERFLAFLKCPTKAYFLAHGEPLPETYFSNVETEIASRYKLRAWRMLKDRNEPAKPLTFKQMADGDSLVTTTRWFECDTAVLDSALSRNGAAELCTRKSVVDIPVVPVVFTPWEKPTLSDNLLLCFGALALSQSTGIHSEIGTLFFGDNLRRKTVRFSDHAEEFNQIINAIGTILPGGQEPRCILNEHCAVCDFRLKCRTIATERDDLSLLSGMAPKERRKTLAKGIQTILQLSYGYRPRRRRRTKPDAERAARSVDTHHIHSCRHDNKLKALAIKKSRIHVVGTPSMNLCGVPVFIDVEGMPDRDFYYLIGLRFDSSDEQIEHSFWADGLEDERKIWEDCLRTIKSLENAQLVHYGAYETHFLRRMKTRYVSTPEDVDFIDRLIESSVNLVTCMYGCVYFPTYSNSLKEIGRYLGYEWAWPHASGASAILMRKLWELSAQTDIKDLLVAYNMDDCRAAALIAEALGRICTRNSSMPDLVDVGSLEVGFQRTFGKFDSALPEFAKINDAAYWDYQRSKVFTRTDKTLRRTIQKSNCHEKISTFDKEITIVDDMPAKCPKCSATKLWRYLPRRSNVVYDLKFSNKGVKRWSVKYRYSYYKCTGCFAEMTFYDRKSKYGPNLRAFLVYLVIELLLSNRKAADHASLLFGLPLTKSAVGHIKSEMAAKYAPTYQSILNQIAKGNLIHADETKGVVLGGGHYVWVFANMTTVAYVYSESRDSGILETVLDGFKGVLVSDFYGVITESGVQPSLK
jgi:predicted RecB family nuclease